ncbi:aminotransferase class V-fold PLP-dependent enzyme [Cupriavidus basilensis]
MGEAINLIAKTWGAQNVGEGDEIIVIAPGASRQYRAVAAACRADRGRSCGVIPVDDSGQVLLDAYRRLLNDRTKIVSVTQVSNALGTVVAGRGDRRPGPPRAGACALVDGAQSVSYMRVDVQAIDADFFVFSGHKVLGPTGIGVVYGKREVLEDMPPRQGGGNAIADVTFESAPCSSPPPDRFRGRHRQCRRRGGAGAAALDYVEAGGWPGKHRPLRARPARVHAARCTAIPGVRLSGRRHCFKAQRAVSLRAQGAAKPRKWARRSTRGREASPCSSRASLRPAILRRFGVRATVRPSLAFYNTTDEVDRLISVVRAAFRRRRH